jgi:hypothetical protein
MRKVILGTMSAFLVFFFILMPISFVQAADGIPPTTVIQIGSPEYTTVDMTYVTSETLFTLVATDNPGGSGVLGTWYMILNTTYTSGVIQYSAPFSLAGLADGVYAIHFMSMDNVGNEEDPLGSIIVTLFSWNYVYEDIYGRGTTLKINTAHEFFQFITPDKDYGIREAYIMYVYETPYPGTRIRMLHVDSELYLNAKCVGAPYDFCGAFAIDKQTQEQYWLIDALLIEP